MKRTLATTAATLVLLGVGYRAAAAKAGDPDELGARADAALSYVCNTPTHDDQFYADFVTAQSMNNWNFKDNTVPYLSALQEVAGKAYRNQDALGIQAPALSDETRTMICTTHNSEFLEAVDRITENEKAGLKQEYQNNEDAIRVFPGIKLAAIEKSIQDEQARHP